MGINKVEFAGEVLIDLTNDTTTAETTLAGYTGHSADGEPFVGKMAAGANITSGADTPSNDVGSDGDYYIKEESQEEVTSETVIQDENTLLLLHGDALTDSSIYNVPITNNGVTVSTAQSKFGGSSLYFDGSSWLKMPISQLELDFLSDWTLEWWDYPTQNNGGASAVYCMPNGTYYGFIVYAPNGDNIRIFAGDDSAYSFAPETNIGEYYTDVWTHRAVCKKNNKIYCFENGIKTAELNSSNTLTITEDMYIGYRATTQNRGGFKGYLSELRISNIARWTENFIPPTESYKTQETISTTNKIPIVAELYNKKQGVWNKIMTGATGGRVIYNVTLTASWSDDLPYTQKINLDGILLTDTPHITPVYSNVIQTANNEKIAWGMINKAITSDNFITFYCYGDKPSMILNLQIEVIR